MNLGKALQRLWTSLYYEKLGCKTSKPTLTFLLKTNLYQVWPACLQAILCVYYFLCTNSGSSISWAAMRLDRRVTLVRELHQDKNKVNKQTKNTKLRVSTIIYMLYFVLIMDFWIHSAAMHGHNNQLLCQWCGHRIILWSNHCLLSKHVSVL